MFNGNKGYFYKGYFYAPKSGTYTFWQKCDDIC